MVDNIITDHTKGRVALFIGGSNFTEYPQYSIIGTGSATIGSLDVTLVTSSDRQAFTSTTFPTSSGIIFQTDWNAAEMSGIQLTEWGLTGSFPLLTGSIWTHHYIDAVTFDGTNELRILETLIVT